MASVEPNLLSPVAGRIQMQESLQATLGIQCESVRVGVVSGPLFPPYLPGFVPKTCGIYRWRARYWQINDFSPSPFSFVIHIINNTCTVEERSKQILRSENLLVLCCHYSKD